MLFETFNVPKMYVAQQPLLGLLSIGRTQGLILDSGLEATYAVPIFDGKNCSVFLCMAIGYTDENISL